jgi:hypothetical protein
MDLVGLVLAASLVAGVFVLFDVAVRIICDAIDDVRYSVTPTVIGGLRAWGDGREESSAPGADDRAAPHDPSRDVTAPRRGDDGVVVPVARVLRGRSRCEAV